MQRFKLVNGLSVATCLLLGASILSAQGPAPVTAPIVQTGSATSSLQYYLQTNGTNQASTTMLNPGIVFYNDGANPWGADLGFNAITNRYRTRLFAAPMGDIVFAFAGTPNSQTSFTESLVIRGDSGNVGVGTSNPLATLDVAGNAHVSGNVALGGLTFTDGTSQTSAAIQVQGNTGGGLIVSGTNLGTQNSFDYSKLSNSGKMLFGWNLSAGLGEQDIVANRGPGAGGGFRFYDYSNQGVMTPLLTLTGQGFVGIGTTTPSTSLEVNGKITLTASSGASITFPDTTVQATAWNGVLSGGDYAESVNVSGAREDYQPGDILVIDPAAEGKFLKSSTPYSTAVTGIYSTKPGVVGRRQLTARTHMSEEVPMAMTGIVPTRVTTENGPIKPGDLLVTSSKSGYAMRGTDRTQMLGAVIGKAIGHLDTGVGIIEAVVTLQ